jgi:eukaryotic-like serine/threonine-protein kinase
MVRRTESSVSERDERLGEAMEQFLALAESGHPPDPDEFVAKHPDLAEDLRAALDGLSLVRGLVSGPGDPGQKLEAGRRVAGYRIVRELGRGGMGVVYEAVHVDLDRPVALKILGAHAAPDSNGRRRFLNEAKTAAGLHHTHIVPVFDVGQVGGLCYYAMQRIEGCGLDRVIRSLRRDRSTASGSSGERPAPSVADGSEAPPAVDDTISWSAGSKGKGLRGRSLEGDAVRDDEPSPFEPARGANYYRWVASVGRQAAEALAHANGRGVIHRDIKPSNLLVDARGTVWVADFGLSRRLADPALTQSDSRLGTPRYMSPEQTRIGPIDARSDVYSLGATLYELLTLKPPFDGRSAVELAQQILDREATPPRRFDPRIPRDLETIVLKAMAKRPSDRYASAQELADDLARFVAFEPVRARRISPVGRLWRFARRHPQLTFVSTASILAVVSVVSIAYIKVASERDRLVVAEGRLQDALGNEKAARREGLYREVKLIGRGIAPNRRERGFPPLKEAASLEPAPELKSRLRDEAVAFLALRDVEARPPIATGPSRGLLFGGQGGRLATLSEDGRELSFWDAETLKRIDHQTLVPQAATVDGAPGAGPGADPPPGRGMRSSPRNRLALASPSLVAVVLPSNRGIRLFDALTGAPQRTLELPGHQIQSILTGPATSRLVTVELNDVGPVRNRQADGVEVKGQRPWQWVVNLWDTEALDQPVKKLVDVPPSNRFAPLVAFSPEGDLVATAILGEPSISLWSAADGSLKLQIPTQTPSTALALGPEGLLAEAGGGMIRFWQVSEKTEAAPLPSLNANQGIVTKLRFSPDGTMLASSVGGPVIELWDLVTDTLSAVLRTPDPVSDLAFSANGRMLAASVVNHQQSSNVAFSVTGSVSVWAVVEPIGRSRLPELKSVPTSISFSPDGELAIASHNESLRLWRAGECPTSPRVLDGVLSVSAAFDAQGFLETTDARTLSRYPRSEHHRAPGATTIGVKAKRATPIESSELPSRSELGGNLGRPANRDGRNNNPRPPGPPPQSMMLPMMTMARSSDNRTLVLARANEVLVRRPGDVGFLRVRFPAGSNLGFRALFRALAVSPHGDRLYVCASVMGAELVQAWALGESSAQGGSHADPILPVTRLPWDLPRDVATLALCPDGGQLALGDATGAVFLIDTTTGRIAHKLPAPTDSEGDNRVYSLAFSPQGNELAVGGRDHARLWALGKSPHPLVWLPGHRGPIRHIVYDPKGEQLATAGEDKVVQVWDLVKVHSELDKLGLDW